ncbi:hypothetical protein L7F22_007384 [Adiantum nelumboides]|nr:hypothetical protein [Adiantum nelumboides]
MHFSSWLVGRADQQPHYARLEQGAMVPEGGGSTNLIPEGDRALLLHKIHETESEEQLPVRCKTPQRFKAFPSPWRPAREPSHGTMNLLVRRMDDTTFVLAVSKKATLLDVKEAVRQKFQADGCEVSWPHVWGHFCLSFRDQKLLDEHAVLYKLGVRDLDELIFVRHLDTRPRKGLQMFNSLRWMQRLTI